MLIAILIVVGLCAGSFVNAVVWRLRKQETASLSDGEKNSKYSIRSGRSMCIHCGRELAAKDLVPIFSWLVLRGKCRYCNQPISWQYPIVELATAALFAASYLLWPELSNSQGILDLAIWLLFLVGFVALVVYDLRWMILPNRIIFPLYGLAATSVLLNVFSHASLQPLYDSALGLLIGGGLFYLLFRLSSGKWIGGGDVKLGFLLGIIVGGPMPALLMLFLASFLGSLATAPFLLAGKVKRNTHIPFGPFLIAAAIVVKLFGSSLVSWYLLHFIS